MIKSDRKVISAILKLTDNCHDELTQDSASPALLLLDTHHNTVRRLPVSVSSEDIEESIQRLLSSGYLRVSSKWMGGFSFCVTSRLKHRKAFWWDAFSKKFVYGFISGLIIGIFTTVLGGLLLSFLRAKLGI